MERFVRACSHCLQTASRPLEASLSPWPNTGKSWSRIHLDFGEPTKANPFIVVVDSYSKFVDAQWMPSTKSRAVISYLQLLFRFSGTPDVLVSDNGPQFALSEFAQFCVDASLVHLRCAPYMPQSNGFAEKTVRTIKDSLDSTSGVSLEAVVRAYIYTPHSTLSENKSPNELFFGRQLRTPPDSFEPRAVVAIPLPEYQERFKGNFDRHHGVTRRHFEKGENVSIELHNGSRVPGVVSGFIGKRMLAVSVQGQELVRHFNQVWKRSSAVSAVPDEASPPTPSREQLPRRCKTPVNYKTLSR